jgi:hypothetical protein
MEFINVPVAPLRELLKCFEDLHRESMVNMKIPPKTKNVIEKTILAKHNLVFSINEMQKAKNND